MVSFAFSILRSASVGVFDALAHRATPVRDPRRLPVVLVGALSRRARETRAHASDEGHFFTFDDDADARESDAIARATRKTHEERFLSTPRRERERASDRATTCEEGKRKGWKRARARAGATCCVVALSIPRAKLTLERAGRSMACIFCGSFGHLTRDFFAAMPAETRDLVFRACSTRALAF